MLRFREDGSALYSNGEPLTSNNADNVLCYCLGEIVQNISRLENDKIGDNIDRGLILLRLINTAGFELREKQ